MKIRSKCIEELVDMFPPTDSGKNVINMFPRTGRFK